MIITGDIKIIKNDYLFFNKLYFKFYNIISKNTSMEQLNCLSDNNEIVSFINNLKIENFNLIANEIFIPSPIEIKIYNEDKKFFAQKIKNYNSDISNDPFNFNGKNIINNIFDFEPDNSIKSCGITASNIHCLNSISAGNLNVLYAKTCNIKTIIIKQTDRELCIVNPIYKIHSIPYTVNDGSIYANSIKEYFEKVETEWETKGFKTGGVGLDLNFSRTYNSYLFYFNWNNEQNKKRLFTFLDGSFSQFTFYKTSSSHFIISSWQRPNTGINTKLSLQISLPISQADVCWENINFYIYGVI
jgi:hypothetical protein